MCILRGERNHAFMTDVLYKNNCIINLTISMPPHYEGQMNSFMYFWLGKEFYTKYWNAINSPAEDKNFKSKPKK